MKEKDVHTVSIKGTIHKACTLVSEQVLKATNAHTSRTSKSYKLVKLGQHYLPLTMAI